MAIKEPSIIASPNRALALTAGAVFALWGVLGFFYGGDNSASFFGPTGGLLFNAFLVNAGLAFIWVCLAALLFIVGLGTVVGARAGNRMVGIAALFLGVYGFVFMNTSGNVFAANVTDNVFHLVIGAVLLLTSLGADRQNVAALRAAARA